MHISQSKSKAKSTEAVALGKYILTRGVVLVIIYSKLGSLEGEEARGRGGGGGGYFIQVD
jgi:hypothetical protein